MKKIVLIRHGQASFGAENYDNLSTLGHLQTQSLGKMFSQTRQQVDNVVSGEMQRQQDSLSNFCQFYQNTNLLKFDNLSQLNEFDHETVLFRGNLGFSNKKELQHFLKTQEKPQRTLMQLFDKSVERWQSGEFDSDYPESWQQFVERSWQGLQTVISNTNDNQCTAIFTSGGVISCILQRILQVSPKQAFDFNLQIANASVTHLLVKRDTILLQTFNEFSYLYSYQTTENPNLITWR